MGLFDFLNPKSLNPTVPAKDRPQTIINSFEDFTTKLYDPAINEYGDYSDGIRLQLILGYLAANNREPEIDKIDPITIKTVLSYYNYQHWANITPTLFDLLPLIQNSSQNIELMEMELDRSIGNKDGSSSEPLSCIPWACLWINSDNIKPFQYPILNKKLAALDFVYLCSCY